MSCPKILHLMGAAFLIVSLSGCTIYALKPQPQPMQPEQPPQQPLPPPEQGEPPQPGGPQGGGAPPPSGAALADQAVTVPAGGGSAEVSFNASAGQRIRIALTAAEAGMQPYGNLLYPDGSSTYSPPINTAANGANQVELTLNQSGRFTLTVFDGSNRGGMVSVRIVPLQ